METNTDKRKTLIRRLLVEQLLPEEKQNLLKRNSVENEMKKQWKQFEDDPRYSGAGKLAPKGQADLAFVEHMIYHML